MAFNFYFDYDDIIVFDKTKRTFYYVMIGRTRMNPGVYPVSYVDKVKALPVRTIVKYNLKERGI